MRRQFTLVELLVVLSLLGMIWAALVPNVYPARETSRQNVCRNNLRQIALAIQNYHSVFEAFPPGASGSNALESGEQTRAGLWGWSTLLLPRIERRELYSGLAPQSRSLENVLESSKEDAALVRTRIELFCCPSTGHFPEDDDPVQLKQAFSTYVACMGMDGSESAPRNRRGVFGVNSRRSTADLTDGASVTFLLGERSEGPAVWIGCMNADPDDDEGYGLVMGSTAHRLNSDDETQEGRVSARLGFSAYHPQGANFAFADGHVKFISDEIDFTPADHPGPPGVYNRLGMIADGLKIDEDAY